NSRQPEKLQVLSSRRNVACPGLRTAVLARFVDCSLGFLWMLKVGIWSLRHGRSFDLPEFGDGKNVLIGVAPVEALRIAKAVGGTADRTIMLHAQSRRRHEGELAINLGAVLRAVCAFVGIADRAEQEVGTTARAQSDLVGLDTKPWRADMALVSS